MIGSEFLTLSYLGSSVWLGLAIDFTLAWATVLWRSWDKTAVGMAVEVFVVRARWAREYETEIGRLMVILARTYRRLLTAWYSAL